LDDWAHKNGVKLCFSRPGKPTDNAYIEAFNGLARTNNTLIIPGNLADIAGLVASAMTVLDRTKAGEAASK